VGNAAVITVIGAFVALGILGVLFYVSTLAKNVYQIKIQMKEDLAYELERLKEHVEKELVQRQRWITRDVAGAQDGKFVLIDEEIAALKIQVKSDLDAIDEKVRKLAALQHALAAKRQAKSAAAEDTAMEPAFTVDSPGRKAAQ